MSCLCWNIIIFVSQCMQLLNYCDVTYVNGIKGQKMKGLSKGYDKTWYNFHKNCLWQLYFFAKTQLMENAMIFFIKDVKLLSMCNTITFVPSQFIPDISSDDIIKVPYNICTKNNNRLVEKYVCVYLCCLYIL